MPRENLQEAHALGEGVVAGISSDAASDDSFGMREPGRLSDIRGHAQLKRALEIEAAGRQHLLLFGPPGSDKTMAVFFTLELIGR